MKNENVLDVFKFEEKAVRVFMINGDPWFVAKDVCEVLEISNSRDALNRLDEDEKDVVLTDTPGGMQKVSILNEYGLYTIVLGSRKPEAKQFKRWITHDVIPTIRKTGQYSIANTTQQYLALSEEDRAIAYFLELKEKKQLQLQVEENKPLVTFAETVLKSKDNILVRELSKIIQDEGINIGEKKLYNKLRAWKLILKNSVNNEPSQYAMNQKLFVVEERTIDTSYGEKITKTTKVTPKGQVYIIEKLKSELSFENKLALK